MTTPLTWKWDSCFQAIDVKRYAETKLKNALLDEENSCRRAMGLPIIVCSIGTTLALLVGNIAEPIIKGLGNIFGSCSSDDFGSSSDDCSFLRGLAYLFVATPLLAVGAAILTPFTVVGAAVSLVAIPIWVAIAPDHFKNFGQPVVDPAPSH